jgi:predicted MFS family arabinose efflux permease
MAAGMGIGRFIYTPILPHMGEALGLSASELGWIASANFIGYLLGAIAAGSPRVSGSPRAWLVAMLAVSALTTGISGVVQDLPLLLAIRFAAGIASAFVIVFSSFVILARLTASGHGGLASVHFAGVGTGIAISAVLVWVLNSAGYGWRAMWIGGGLLSAAALVAVLALVPDSDAQRGEDKSIATGRDSRLLRLTLAYGLFGFGYVITATFIVAIVRGAAEIRSLEPVVWLLFGLAAVPSVAAWMRVGRRIGTTRAFAFACVVEAIGVAASVASAGAAAVIIGAALLGGTFMGLTALGLLAARSLPGVAARKSLAQLTAAFGLGQIIGPLVAGYGRELTGSYTAPSLAAAAALLAAALLTARLAL